MQFKIIDAHMHLGNWPEYYTSDSSLKSLLRIMNLLSIEKAISTHCLSINGHFAQGAAEDKKAWEASKGRIYGFLYFDPNHPQTSEDVIMEYCNDNVFRGIKIHPAGSHVDADDERYKLAWDIARKIKKPILAHTWGSSSYNPNQKSAFAGKFRKYIAEYPDVPFVFGHSGGRYDGIKEAVRIGKQHKNCYFDIAGDISGYGVLEYLAEQIGAERIMYGSDCFMIEQRPMLGVVIGSALSAKQKEGILRYNAEKIYFSDARREVRSE